EEGGTSGSNTEGTGLRQLSFAWWNGAVPLAAILGLFALSRMRFGISTDEIKTILEAQAQAQSRPAPPAPAAAPRAAAPAPVARARAAAPITASRGAGMTRGARLVAIEPIDPVPAEYSLLKDEVSLGRSEESDVVIPHASVSRTHARLRKCDGGY